MRLLRSDSFQWLASLFCSLLGTIMLVQPHQFNFIQTQTLSSFILLVGASLIFLGPGMLLVIVLRLSRRLLLAVNLLTALILILLASALIAAGGWINGANFFILAAGIALVPFLNTPQYHPSPLSDQPAHGSGDLLGLVAGVSSLLVSLLLFWPGELTTFHYYLSVPASLFFGLLFFAGGLALVVLALPAPPLTDARRRAYHLLTLPMAAVFLIFPFLAGNINQLWFSALFYISVGLGLAVFPRLFSPGSWFRTDTLYVRMAILFSICVSLPLVLISTLVARLDEIMLAFQLPQNFLSGPDVILAALLVIVTLTILGGLRLAHAVVAPLGRLAAAANALSDGRPDITLPTDSGVQEVQRLTGVFSTLRARLNDRTQAWEQARTDLLQQQAVLERRVEERTAALAIANRRLESVLRALPLSVIITDEQGNIVRKNDFIEQGLGVDTSVYKNLQDFNSIDARWSDTGTPVRGNEWGLARAVLYGETSIGQVMDLHHPDGITYTIVHSAAPIVEDDGKIIGAVAVGQDISRQRELERISRDAARHARQTAVQVEAIFNALSDSVVVYNAEGVVIQANSQAVALFGFEPLRMTRAQVVLNLKIADDQGEPITPETMPSALAQKGEAQANKRFTLVNARKRRYTVLVSSSPVYVGRELIGAVAIWHDITERERLMEENRRQHDLLQTLIAKAPAAIAFVEGRDFRYALYNEAYEQIGRGKGPMMGRTVAEVWPELSETLIPLMERVMATGEAYSASDQRFLINREAGPEENYFTFNFTPIRGMQGISEGLMILATETTEQVRAGHAVFEEQARFRSLVESITDIVCTLDEKQRFTGLYGRSAEAFGLAPEYVIGKTIYDLLRDSADPHIKAFEQVKTGANVVYESSIQRRGGLQHFQISLSPLWVEGRVCGAVAVVRDITEMKKARIELEKFASQLQRSNQELEQFAFIASHDLQEPLRKIRAFGERVVDRMQDRITEEEQDYLNRMNSATQRMQRMIEDLLTFSRVTTKGNPFELVDLNLVAEEVLSDLEVRMERSGGTVEMGNMPTLEADPMQMHQLLQNLIGNALKYHRRDLPPRVEVRTEIIPQNSSLSGDMMRMQVIDNGIGFDEQLVERIFQPFERLHGRAEYEGTGMGLAICRKIVERHHGSITASSRPGEGSIFLINLPLRQPEDKKSEGALSRSPAHN